MKSKQIPMMLFAALPAMAMLLVCSAPALAQMERGAHGHVTGADGEPLNGASIIITPLNPVTDSPVISGTTTDRNGNYSIPSMPPGMYEVKVKKGEGYATQTMEITENGSGPTNFDKFNPAPVQVVVRLNDGATPESLAKAMSDSGNPLAKDAAIAGISGRSEGAFVFDNKTGKLAPAGLVTLGTSTDLETGVTTTVKKDAETGRTTVTQTDAEGKVVSEIRRGADGTRDSGIGTTDPKTGESQFVMRNPNTGKMEVMRVGENGRVETVRPSAVEHTPPKDGTLGSSTELDTGLTTTVRKDPDTGRTTVTKTDSEGRVISEERRGPAGGGISRADTADSKTGEGVVGRVNENGDMQQHRTSAPTSDGTADQTGSQGGLKINFSPEQTSVKPGDAKVIAEPGSVGQKPFLPSNFIIGPGANDPLSHTSGATSGDANAPAMSAIRPEGLKEMTGDVIANASGGSPVPAGSQQHIQSSKHPDASIPPGLINGPIASSLPGIRSEGLKELTGDVVVNASAGSPIPSGSHPVPHKITGTIGGTELAVETHRQGDEKGITIRDAQGNTLFQASEIPADKASMNNSSDTSSDLPSWKKLSGNEGHISVAEFIGYDDGFASSGPQATMTQTIPINTQGGDDTFFSPSRPVTSVTATIPINANALAVPSTDPLGGFGLDSGPIPPISGLPGFIPQVEDTLEGLTVTVVMLPDGGTEVTVRNRNSVIIQHNIYPAPPPLTDVLLEFPAGSSPAECMEFMQSLPMVMSCESNPPRIQQ